MSSRWFSNWTVTDKMGIKSENIGVGLRTAGRK